MKLTVGERLILLSILPNEGSFLTLKIIRDLKMALSFTEAEHKKYKFVQEGVSVHWDEKANKEKEVEIGETANVLISSALSKLNDEKKLKMEHFTIYEKFIDKKQGGV